MFAHTDTSQAKGKEFLGRFLARTEDRDAPTDDALRDAQYDAIVEWGVPDHAALQRLTRVGPRIECRHHDDADRLSEHRVLLHDPADFPTITARHHDIEQDHRGTHRLVHRQRLVSVVGNRDRVATDLEVLSDDLRVVMIVVHHQDRR